MANLDKKRANKLKKVNVPEMFFQTFLADIPAGTSSIVDRLNTITPTARGRGLSRVIENLTHAEWDDLYAYAAKARASIVGADRETELKPAICGKALAIRMEELGVTNPVPWSPSKTYKPRVKKAEQDLDQDNTPDTTDEDVITTVSTPITIPTADDVDDLTEEELRFLGIDIQQQKA